MYSVYYILPTMDSWMPFPYLVRIELRTPYSVLRVRTHAATLLGFCTYPVQVPDRPLFCFWPNSRRADPDKQLTFHYGVRSTIYTLL